MKVRPENKAKVLFTASITKHILAFHLPFLKWFQEKGYEVHVAARGQEVIPYCDQQYDIPFVRTPFSSGHFKAFRKLKAIIEQGQYHIIHCHTPMASVLTRIAAEGMRQNGTKVLYTSHGFHFYKGSPIMNWVLYYPVEYILSSKTDAIITINREDFDLVQNNRFHNKATHRIYGIGVDGSKFTSISLEEKLSLRKQYCLSENDYILIYVAEFILRKNHEFVIRAAAKMREKIPNLKILFAGRGVLQERMKALVEKLNLESVIIFLGFRKDIQNVIRIADVGISASKQEGLGLNLIEEALTGLPLVATEDRGHREIIIPNKNGFLYPQKNEEYFVNYIYALYQDPQKRVSMGKVAIEEAQKFLLGRTMEDLSKIYLKYMEEDSLVSKRIDIKE